MTVAPIVRTLAQQRTTPRRVRLNAPVERAAVTMTVSGGPRRCALDRYRRRRHRLKINRPRHQTLTAQRAFAAR